MYLKRYLQKRLIVAVITVIMISLVMMVSSYALFMNVRSNTKDQVLSVGNLQITFLGGSAINLNNIEPMSDTNALDNPSNVYTFSIENTGSIAYCYSIAIENNQDYLLGGPSYNASAKLLNHDYIRYSINGDAPATLGEANNGIITNDTLNPSKTKLFNVRLWVADATEYQLPNEALGSEVHLNINVDGKACGDDKSLKTAILDSDGGATSITTKGTPVYQYQIEPTGAAYNTTIASSSNKAVATAYTFDGTYYQLTNPTINITYNSGHIGMYTCGTSLITTNNTGTDCTHLFKINTVDGSGNITASTRYLRLIKEISAPGLYATADDDGSSYYYWGAVQNNNLIFAGFQWKIIRITGNDDIKLIYNGICNAPDCIINTLSNATQLDTKAFNTMSSDNRYVGYMYGNTCDTYTNCHTNNNDSTIKAYIDEWYANNIANQNSDITDKIADVVYCSDRSPSTSSVSMNGLGGDGITYTYYGAYIRLVNDIKIPSLGCSRTEDRFTVNGINGNGKLTYPVGLITADEIVLAGGDYHVNNRSYYLYTSRTYLSMTPDFFNSTSLRPGAWCVSGTGYLATNIVTGINGVRPVIALDGNVIVTGDGSSQSPYYVFE